MAESDLAQIPKKVSLFRDRGWLLVRAVRRSNLPASIACVILLTLVLAAIAAPWITPHDPVEQDLHARLEMPSLAHPLGTDDLGRDTLSRIIWGSRITMQVGAIAVGLAVLIGVPIGLIAGYRGGVVDTLLMRGIDSLLAFPPLLLAMAIMAGLGPGIRNAMAAIGIVFVPTFARLARGSTLVVRETDYVQAARALGAGTPRIVLRHVLPNIMVPIIVQASLASSIAVIVEASLAYLGLGSQPPDPSWGVMLRQASSYMQDSWFVTLPPGVAIFLVAVALGILGDHLRDILDPRLRGA